MSYNKEIFNDQRLEDAYQIIKERVLANKTPDKTPLAVVLGGLPGSGKGNIYGIYNKRLNGNIVQLDCDKFRKFHPDAQKFSVDEYSKKTNKFVFAVVDRIIDEITPEKYNFIAESSMRAPDVAFDNTKNLKPIGYNVEIAIMATNKDLAWQGTIDRYTEAEIEYRKNLSKGETDLEPPRKVDEVFFDTVTQNIEKSLDMIYKSRNEKDEPQIPVDDIYIFNRDKEILYHMAETPELNPVPILSARLHHSEEESKKIIDDYIHSSEPSDIEKSGAAILNEMAENNELFNKFLKFQGSIFKQNAYVALEFFAQKPDVNFVATASQWTDAGYRIKPGAEGLIYTHIDGSVHEFFDFSQIDAEKPPVIWHINDDNVNKIKSQLKIPENTSIANGLINKYISSDNIKQCMMHLNITGNDKEFATYYLNSVRAIIAGRLEVGGQKFGVSADNSILKSLSHKQRMQYIAICTQTARAILKEVEAVVKNIETERKMNNDLRTVDETNNRREADSTQRRTSGNFNGPAQEQPDIVESDKNGRESDNVGNSSEYTKRKRDDAVSGVPQKDDKQSADVVSVQSDDRHIQPESDQSGALSGRRTDRDLRTEMDGVHEGELPASDGTAENGTQIPDSSKNSGSGSDGIQDASGRTVHEREPKTDNIRGNSEVGTGTNDTYGQHGDEGKSPDTKNRITDSFSFSESVNTEKSVDSADVSLRIDELSELITAKETEMQMYMSNKEYGKIAQTADELEKLNGELENLRNNSSDSNSSALERAKQLISDFVTREYKSKPNFDDLSKISIAHTTYTDLEIPVQVDANLEDYTITYSFNNKVVNTEKYSSLEEMNSLALEHMDFDSFISLTNEEMIAGMFEKDETVNFTVVTINERERFVAPGYVTDVDEINEYTELKEYGERIEISYEFCSIGDEGESDSASSEQIAYIEEYFDYLDRNEHYQVIESDQRTINNPYFEPSLQDDLEEHLNTDRNIPDKYDYKGYFLLPDDEDNLFTSIKSVKPTIGEWTDINDLADILSIEDIQAINAACVDLSGIPLEKDMPPETFTLLYQKSNYGNTEYRSAIAKFNERIEEAYNHSETDKETTTPAIHEDTPVKRYETVNDMLSDFDNAYLSLNRPVSEEFLNGKYLLSNKNNHKNIFDNTVNNVELSNGQRVRNEDALAALNVSPSLSISRICVDLIDTEEYNYHRNRGDSRVALLKPEEFFALYKQTQKLINGEDIANQHVIRDVERSREIIEKAHKTVSEYISDKEYMPYIIDHFFARDEMENFSREYKNGAEPIELAKNNIGSVSAGFTAPGTYDRNSGYFSMGVTVNVTTKENGDGVDVKHQDTVVHYTWDEISEQMQISVNYFDAFEDAYEKAYNIPDSATSERKEIIADAFSEICEKYEITAENEAKPYIDYIQSLTTSNNLPVFDQAFLRGYNAVERFGAPEYFDRIMDGKLFDFISDVNGIIGPNPDPLEAEKELPEKEPEFIQTTLFETDSPAPTLPPQIVDGYNLTEILTDELMRGSGFENGKFRITEYFQNSSPDNRTFADFLKNEYGIGGRSGISPVLFQNHDSKGIELELENKKKYGFTWSDVAKQIAHLISENQYITQDDIENRLQHAKYVIANYNADSVYDKIALEHAHRVLREYNQVNADEKNTVISYAEAYDMHRMGYDVDGYPEDGLDFKRDREKDFFVTELAYNKYQDEKRNLFSVYEQPYYELSGAMKRMSLDIDNDEDRKKAKQIHEISSSVQLISNSFKDIPANLELSHEFDLTRPETAKVVFNGLENSESIYSYVEQKLAKGDTEKIYDYLETVRKSYYLQNPVRDCAYAALDTLKKFEKNILNNQETENDIPGDDAEYTIYQLKSSSEIPDNHYVSFIGTDEIEKFNLQIPDISRYNEIWSDKTDSISGTTTTEKLENIFIKFNTEKPENFHGHSLSVSDIIVVKDNEKNEAYYVDTIGFTNVTDRFYNPEKENVDELLAEQVKSQYPDDYIGVMEELSDLANDDDYTHNIGDYIEYEGNGYRIADFKNATLELENMLTKENRLLTVEELHNSELGYRFLRNEEITELLGNNSEEKTDTELSESNEVFYDEDDHSDDDLPDIAYAKNPVDRFNDNLSAIRELKALERRETEFGYTDITEYAKNNLRRYVGWGGLSQIFDENSSENEFRRSQLKSVLTDEEYNAARSSTLNAHFTPQIVIDAMYKAIKNMELPRNARILEPACGTGNFISRLPANFSESEVVGIELDNVTARIADWLNKDNKNVTIINSAFEKSGLEDNSFDLAVGNVPFGNYNMIDPEHSNDWKIHDAFFRKALDKVAASGVVAFITSTGTLDKKNPKVREYLAQKSDLIGAIRLPNNTFSDAGTKTATDIIFLQKRENPRLKTDDMPDWCYTTSNEDGLKINSYFVNNPQMVLGKMEQTSHFNMLTCSPVPGADLEKQLDEAIKNLNAKITVKKREDAAARRQGLIEPWGKNFSYQITDDGVYFRENNMMREIKIAKADKEKLSMLCDIRSAARELIDLQRTPITDNQLIPYREKLNELYDKYTEKYGCIANSKATKIFGLDSDFPLVMALENYDKQTNSYSKAEIFYKRTVSPYIEIAETTTLEEALQISMDRKGKIDVPYMADLLKNTYTEENVSERIANELISKGYAYIDPDAIVAGEPYASIKERTEYLSGNVRMKLKAAENYAETHPEFIRNVEALKKVIPEDIKAEEITVQMGCSWIDEEDYTKFLEHLSGRKPGSRNCDVTYSALTGEFSVNQSRSKIGLNVNETKTYGTADFSLYNLAEKILNQRRIVVKREVVDSVDPSKKVTRTDVKATKLANDMAKQIKQEFKKWIFEDKDRKEKYERRYNNIFNSLVGRSYDGSNLTFPGMSSDFVLRPHQKDCVARTIYGGNTLAAHVVGAGKSAVIISSVMKKKDIGLINKACVVVPKPLTEQTANEWRKLYPDARVLTVKNEDLASEEKRKIFTAKVATGSYDAVIVSQEQFEKLAMSKEYQAEYIRKQLDELEEHLKESKDNRYSVKDIETRKKKLKDKIEKITNPSSAAVAKDNLLEFESLGFDYLVVDEAHAYKNGFVMTKMNNVAGVTTRPSGRAEDMQMKTDYFNKEFGQGHILFATGTPVSNSMTELYVMTRYLRPDLLKAQGIDRFDDWAATFGSVVTKNQQTSAGTLKLKTKFASFSNLPELMAMYKEFADIQSAEKLNLPRPKLKENKVQIIKAQATSEQKKYVKELADRAQAYEDGKVDSSVDNHLKITGEARLVGLGNMVVKTLYERRGEEPPANFAVEKDSKVDLCIQKVAELYKKTDETKGVQIIFSDIAVNSDNGNFSVYDYIKNELVNEYGIPENEIVFGPKSDAKNREKIFADINNSKYRVVIASTDTLGTGANIQQNLYALHHLDTPWKPSDFTQREGRILRQGNKNPEVEIFNYVTEGTLDSYLYQTVTDKARFIAQLLDNNAPARVSEDCDEKVLSFAEIQAAAEGNPDFKRRIELSNDIAEYTMLKNEYDHETAVTKEQLALYPKNIQKIKETIENSSKDLSSSKIIAEQDLKIKTHEDIVLTEKKEINSYLLSVVQNQMANPTSPSPKFSINDFTVSVKATPVNQNNMLSLEDCAEFEISGELNYRCEAGRTESNDNYTRLHNFFDKVVPEKHKELNANLNELEDNMKQAEERVARPFPHEHTLEKLTEEYNQLEEKLISLSAETDEFTDSDEQAMPDTEEKTFNTQEDEEDNFVPTR